VGVDGLVDLGKETDQRVLANLLRINLARAVNPATVGR
jgi:hypothetical protein